MLQVVLQFNEKYSIVAINKANLLLELRCPELGFVRPVTLPFTTAPGIPQLKQLDLFTLVLKLVDRDE